MKSKLIGCLGILAICCLMLLFAADYFYFGKMGEWFYDLRTGQTSVESKKATDDLLASFETLPLSKLNDAYQNHSMYNDPKYLSLTKGRKFYLVSVRKHCQINFSSFITSQFFLKICRKFKKCNRLF